MKKLLFLPFLFLIILSKAQTTQNICVTADCKSTVKYPQDTVTLNGVITSTSPDSVKSASWTNKVGTSKIDNTAIAATVARGLAAGGATLYVYQLTGTSKNGAIGTALDSIIYVPNQPPTAVTGPPILDSTTTTATLSGSNSTDPEGLPLTFLWSQASGPNTATISTNTMSNPIVSNLINGVYSFQLVVKDSGGLTSTATQSVTVKSPAPVTVTKVVTIVTKSDGTTTTTQAYP